MKILLSEKHGVNPTMPICFWCGEKRGEIALLGKLKGDAEAPRECLLDYEPCERCKENFSKGIHLIGIVTEGEGKPIYKKDGQKLFPTGTYAVVTEEAIDRMFPKEIAESSKEKGKCFVDDLALRELLGDVI